MWPSKTKAACAFLAPSPTKRQGWALQRKLFRKRARHFPRSHRPFSINGKIAAFFSLLVSREADAGNGHAACACPFLTQHGPLFCPPERKGPRPSVGKIFAPCMILGTSTQKRGLPGKIRALCIRNRPIVPRNGYMGRRSCQLQREKHASRANAASEALFFMQSAKRGYMARESCHSSQSNLEDRHNESIGRQNANPKKDPGTTAKSPNTKATPTRPLLLAARSNTQINLPPRRFPQGRQSSQHETISKTAQHQGSLEKSCLRKLIRRSSMST